MDAVPLYFLQHSSAAETYEHARADDIYKNTN